MAVFRVEKTRDYTIMANHHLKDKSLTLKAKGLLSVMLSLPESWDYTLKGLSMINKEGVDAIREAIRELERAGYILRSRTRNDQGQLKNTEYVIYEFPHPRGKEDDEPESDSPALEKPMLENPILDNPTLGNPTLEDPALEKPTLENSTQLNTNREKKKRKIKNPFIPDVSNPYQSNPYPSGQGLGVLPMTPRKQSSSVREMREQVKQNIGYECMIADHDKSRVDEIVDLMVETLCSSSEYITISGADYPAELVKERLLKINSLHLQYIFECLQGNSSRIRNIKHYLLTTLFNAASTMSSYYDAQCRHDFSY